MTDIFRAADHHPFADLANLGETLKVKAAQSGVAGESLATYPNHHTMLTHRTQDGPAEIHAAYADIFYIVRGTATLLTEGTLEGAYEESLGETRAKAVIGGKETVLATGDMVHIPAGTPHQLRIADGDEFLYFVIKVKESN